MVCGGCHLHRRVTLVGVGCYAPFMRGGRASNQNESRRGEQ